MIFYLSVVNTVIPERRGEKSKKKKKKNEQIEMHCYFIFYSHIAFACYCTLQYVEKLFDLPTKIIVNFRSAKKPENTLSSRSNNVALAKYTTGCIKLCDFHVIVWLTVLFSGGIAEYFNSNFSPRQNVLQPRIVSLGDTNEHAFGMCVYTHTKISCCCRCCSVYRER